MAVITTKGDPNEIMEKAMPALYGAVYTLKFQLKKQGTEFKVGKLIGRWPDAHLVPRDEWTGIWGLPVPPGTTEMPQKSKDYSVRLETSCCIIYQGICDITFGMAFAKLPVESGGKCHAKPTAR